jgi:VCBS repeat-containing protein
LAGKFTDLLPDGQGAHLGGHVHVDSVSTHAPAGAIIVPDAHLLFTGDFKRAGVDLILSGDGRELVLHDYFKGEKRAALASSDGAHLTGDIVNALTGHTQLAQADGSPSVAQVIGHVTKLVGTATAIRNGVSIILNSGDNVNKGDVVQSGSDSTLGITFIDGSVFGLASNAKMVLNEMIYDPNGSNNSSLISLVQGTISFVAGATAKKGDMKVDTPVATMGIRGTAVLVEIDFVVPGQGGAPPAKFQVLVEPDGTTGSYILFDKTTLTPIATVNQAGTQTIVNGQGTVNFLSNVPLSPDAQNIISKVFELKFTDLNNPQSLQRFGSTPISDPFTIKTAGGQDAFVTLRFAQLADAPIPTAPGVTGKARDHIPGPPDVVTTNADFTERAGLTGSSTSDTLTGQIRYADINPGDQPTAQAAFNSFKYENAQHSDVSASLTAEQIAAIHAVQVPLFVVQDPNLKNTGTATWTYTVPDGAFDFLAAGETLTLVYMARVDNNFALNNEITFAPITITITGTNDAPTVATTGGTVIERIGTGNTAVDSITGTVTFTDADLTDRPVVTAALSTTQPFKYLDAEGHDVTASLTPAQLAAIAAVKVPLKVVQGASNGHNGTATWTYSIADHAFDFIADEETLILNYVIKVDDGHGGVVFTPVSISINGADVTVIGTNDLPTIATTSDAFAELSNGAQPNPTGSPTPDTASGTITFTDVDLTDRPVVSTAYTSFTYNDASGHARTLTAQQLADVTVALDVVQTPGNSNDGSATWTYSVADGKFDFLAVNEILTLTYTATVNDGHGGVITKPITITITGTNDTPVIAGGAQTGSITEAADVHNSPALDTAQGTIHFADVDQSDTHDVTITGVSASGVTSGLAGYSYQFGWLKLGALTDTTGGVTGAQGWTFSAADYYFDYLADGESATLTYTVKIDDHHGGTTTKNVVVTVHGSNDAPEVAVDVSGNAGTALHAIAEKTGVTGSTVHDTAAGSLAFQDVDLSDTHTAVNSKAAFGWLDSTGHTLSLTLSQIDVLTSASALTLALHDSTGTGLGSVGFSYSAVDSAFDFLAAGEKLTVTYDITVADEHGVASTRPVTFTVTGTNDVATIDGGSTGGLKEDATTGSGVIVPLDTVSGVLTVHDVDHGEGHFRTVAPALLNGTYGTFTFDSVTGAWTYKVDSSKIQSLGEGVTRTETLTVTSADGTAHKDIVVTITGTNDVATFGGQSSGSLVEDATTGSGEIVPLDTVSGTLTVSDVDTGEGHFLTVDPALFNGTYGTFTFDSENGAWTYQLDNSRTAVQALGGNQHVTDTLTVTSADGTHKNIVVNITGTNDAPEYSSSDLTSTYHVGDSPVALVNKVLLSDIDSDNYNGGTLTATVTAGGHEGDTLTIVPDDHISLVASGTTVMYDADGPGGAGPVAIGTMTNDDYNSLLVTLNGSADDGAVKALTEAIKFSNTTGNPVADTRTVAFTLHDGGGTDHDGHDSAYFEAHVTVPEAPGAAPVIQTDQFSIVEHGDGVTTVAGLYVTDADASETENYTFTATTGASPASSAGPSIDPGHLIDVNDALQTTGVTYFPGNNPQPETDSVKFTVTDGLGHSDTVNFIFNNQDGDGPVTLNGTDGKDVIFATGNTDTLTGGAGADQFVFRVGDGNDTITDFASGQDHLDLRAFFQTIDSDNIDQWLASANVTTNDGDTLLRLGDDSITLKHVVSLTHNDFILSPGGSHT